MNKLESKLRAFISHVRPRWKSTEMSMAITLLEDVANEIESMKAKNAELVQLIRDLEEQASEVK